MSQKFSLVIEVKKNGDFAPTVYKKEDAGKALQQFQKLRDEGKEAYFFQHPKPDKRCKSAEQIAASAPATGAAATLAKQAAPANTAEAPAEAPKKKNSIFGF